jgi:hypothetical protein
MFFKVTNHLLGFIPVEHIRRDTLELRSPGLGDNLLEVGPGLFVLDFEIHSEPVRT